MGKNWLKSLIIKDFFEEEEDVCIQFNRDLNILVGKNGCGKTTILKILNTILDCNIKDLVKFSFSEVSLETNIWTLSFITNKDEFKTIFKLNNIEEQSKNYTFIHDRIGMKGQLFIEDEFPYDLEIIENIENKLKDKINSFHSFIPLTRTHNFNLENRINSSNNRFHERIKGFQKYSEQASFRLEDVLELIDQKYRKYSFIQRRLDDSFKRKILQLPFEVTNSNILDEKVKKILEFNNKTKDQILSVYSELGVPEKTLMLFFDELLEHQKLLKENNISNSDELLKFVTKNFLDSGNTLNFVMNDSKFELAERILKLANENKELKKKHHNKFDLFIEILNNFFKENNKEISFDHRNDVIIKNSRKNKKIKLENLSSGEKQLITMFGFLIFNENNLFMIDEPELSLHIDWQMDLSKKLMTIDDKNQYILATHSPEIIGEYMEKCIRVGEYNYVAKF